MQSPGYSQWWRGREGWPGQLAAPGGATWTAALIVLANTGDIDFVPVRILFGIAGLLAGIGLWRLARTFSSRTARLGGRGSAIAAVVVGGGFAIGTFAGFILAYFGLLFFLPLGMLILGIGLLRSRGLPAWVRAIPLIVAGSGAVLYGFHALARNVWDPHDALWLGLVGGAWLLLGFAGFRRQPTGAPHAAQ